MSASERILITGASRGIGRHLAEALARPGRRLVLVSRKVRDEVVEACERRGAQVCAVGAELSRRRDVEAMLDVVLADGHVDMLVNCAGVVGQEVAPWQADPDDWWHTQKVNVRAPFLIQRRLVPAMIAAGGGRILDLSSGAAVTDTPDTSAYYVSKTALMRLGGSIHEAAFDRGVRVLELAPGVVETDMTRGMRAHEGRTEWTAPQRVAEIAVAFADGLLDGLSGCQVRAGSDDVADLIARSARGVGPDERRLRRTDFA
ncbi:MAG: SDR family oxidoreductase [Actinomycetaceae bacterium]|nr:SDR family oxidoreductase [Actinomycetaceae bacterium]